jgi:hypothetical protein
MAFDMRAFTKLPGGGTAFQRPAAPGQYQAPQNTVGAQRIPGGSTMDPNTNTGIGPNNVSNWTQRPGYRVSRRPDSGAAFAGYGGAGAGLEGQFTSKLMEMMNTPGISEKTTEGIINRGTDEINAGQMDAQRNLTQMANAMGFGTGGGNLAANRQLATDFGGQRANLARDVRLDAAMKNAQSQYQSLGLASDWLGRQKAIEAQAQSQREAREQANAGRLEAFNSSRGGGGGGGLKVLDSPGGGGGDWQAQARAQQMGGFRSIGGGTGLYAGMDQETGQQYKGGAGFSSGGSPQDRMDFQKSLREKAFSNMWNNKYS